MLRLIVACFLVVSAVFPGAPVAFADEPAEMFRIGMI